MTATPAALSAAEESLYRQHFLRQDGQRMIYGCVIGALYNLAILRNDYQLLGDTPAFHVLVALRSAFSILSAVTLMTLIVSPQPRRHDAMAIAWGLAVAPLTVLVALSRPDTFTHNLVAEIAIVALLYLIMPDNPRWRALPSLLLSAGSLGVLLLAKQPIGGVALQSVLFSYLVANFAFFFVARQIFRYRRQIWKNERTAQELAQERLEMLQMKNRLVTTLSHEFRTPLNAVASSASLLTDYRERLSDAQRTEIGQRMDAAIARMTEILDQALFIARRDSRRAARQPAAVDIGPWLESLAGEIRALHPDCPRLAVSLDGTAAGTRRIDPELTRLILGNLVANACKFTAGDGSVEVGLGCDEQGLTLRVCDEGIGIPADELPRVFESFYRAGNARLHQGTGLGLTIAKEATERLGGEIHIASEPGRGTTVAVRLPWLEEKHD
jgi:signal transduction histidine kinase